MTNAKWGRAVSWIAVVSSAVLMVACNGGGGGNGNDGSGNGGPFAGGFVGLANVELNTTTCGECHPTEQGNWEQTAHAHAFQTLDAIHQSDPSQPCGVCHNVDEKGNDLTDPTVGWPGTPVAALRNVQCENCHGPGAQHIADHKLHPEATLAVSTTTGCGECHQGEHHPFVEEWMQSAHANSNHTGAELGLNVAGDPECAPCHVAQSFIAFIKSGGSDRLIVDDPQPITCPACHDPHGNGHTAQLRQLPDTPIVCGQCHQSGPTDINGAPHHPQLDMLLGTGGFRFPGEEFPGAATHGNTDRNPDLCANCHIVTEPGVSGPVSIPAETGHTFDPLPVDPITGQRNFSKCLECHSDPASILDPHQQQVQSLIDQLQAAVDAVPADKRDNDTYKGAVFNLNFVVADKSVGVHNPALTLQLLQVSIAKVQAL